MKHCTGHSAFDLQAQDTMFDTALSLSLFESETLQNIMSCEYMYMHATVLPHMPVLFCVALVITCEVWLLLQKLLP